jgi:dinuclear metal center YbgI/SA1388 family protein
MKLTELAGRLDEELRTAEYAAIDPSANGLQVGQGQREVERVAFAVDAALETVAEARAVDADLLVTHHGFVFGGLDRVTGREYERIASLIEGDLALYTSHLPLDGHQDLGNAARLCERLDLGNRAPFGAEGDLYLGQRGEWGSPRSVEDVVDALSALDTGGRSVQVLDFGPDELTSIGVVTGSGSDWVDEAAETGVDALVTGEGKQAAYHRAKEAGVTVFLAGHYATETGGVRALQDLVGGWGLETAFISAPTGL